MLLDRARSLKAKIELLGAQEVEAGDAQKFATRVYEINPPVTQIKALVATFEEMHARGISVDISNTDFGSSIEQRVAGIRARLGPLAERYAEDEDSILEPDGDARHGFWEPLAKFPGHLETMLRSAWSLHVDNKVKPLPERIVSALASGSSGWADLQETYRRVREMQDETPTPALLDELEELQSNEKQLRDALGADDKFEDIWPFILAAQDGQASLDMLTPEIAARLEERGITDLFRISFNAGIR